MTTEKKKTAQAGLTPTSDTTRVNLNVKVPLTENIIFIGSEVYYDLFWLKMMFIGAAYPMARQMRTADRVVIAYVDEDYTHLEKLAIDQLAQECKAKALSGTVEVMKLGSSAAATLLFNREREDYKLLDVYFSSHGEVGVIDLNYWGDTRVRFDRNALNSISATAFARYGRVHSYACRTGVSVEDFKLGFKQEADAQPENSLAQQMADRFGIDVYSFLRRTFYGNVLRDPSMSDAISSTLRQGRASSGNAAVIDIPPEHEGLPHLGLANRWGRIPKTSIPTPRVGGPLGEGTDNYALWRKRGGLGLPSAAESPAGVGTDMRVFKPSKTQN